MLFRRLSIACLLVVCGLVASQALAQAPTKIKFILNWKYYGPQAWFFLAQDKGYFKAEGLDVEFDQGDGSPGAPTKVASGAYDAGFGDLPTVIQLAAQRPVEAPIGVYMMYSNPPYVIAVKKSSGIVKPKDLEGKTIGGPANDGALRLWPAFAKTAGIDPSKVKIENMTANLREQMLQRGQIDAAFGFLQTIWFSAKAIGILAGHPAPFQEPSSPEAVTNVTPECPADVVKRLSYDFSPRNSPPPQLSDTAETPGWLRAVFTAVVRSPRLSDFASTSSMLAPGAMACAHSTSSAISTDQPVSGAGKVLE